MKRVATIRPVKILPACAYFFLAIILITACSEKQESIDPAFSTQPQLITTKLKTPLIALVTFSANKPVQAHYLIKSEYETWEYVSDGYRIDHHQPLLGLKKNQTYKISISLLDEAGRKVDLPEALEFTSSGELENTADQLSLVKTFSGRLANNIALISLSNHKKQSDGPGFELDQNYGLILGVNNKGEVVWAYQAAYPVDAIEQNSPDTVTLLSRYGRETVNFFGEQQSFWAGEKQISLLSSLDTASPDKLIIKADSLHSESVQLANGHRLLLSTKLQSAEGKADNVLIGDEVLEVSPSGDIVKRWNLFDLLDDQRVIDKGEQLAGNVLFYADNDVPGSATLWTQANHIAYQQSTDTIIVSLKSQDAIVGINKTSGELKWILANKQGWRQPWSEKRLKPVQETDRKSVAWAYSPSSLWLTDNDEIMFIDNAMSKSTASRIVRIRVDEQTMRFEQLVSYPVDVLAGIENQIPALSEYKFTPLNNFYDVLLSNNFSNQVLKLNLQSATSDAVNSIRPKLESQNLWSIADVLLVPELVTVDAYRLTKVNSKATVADKPVAESKKELKADVHLPDIDITGSWQMDIGEYQQELRQQQLVLMQEGKLVTGKLDDFPVTAWVKGNTFSMTLRRYGSEGQVRLRYRGVIDDSSNQIQGTFSIAQYGTILGQTVWTAYKR